MPVSVNAPAAVPNGAGVVDLAHQVNAHGEATGNLADGKTDRGSV